MSIEGHMQTEPVTDAGARATPPDKRSIRIEQLLVDQGSITAGELAAALGRQPGKPAVELETCTIAPEVLKLVPESLAKEYEVIPLSAGDGSLYLAMAN